jgi:DNA-binding MarR family transcriptional regulator
MNISSKSLERQLDQVKELESLKTFQLARLSKILEHHGQSMVQGSGVNLTGYRMLLIINIFDEITLSDLSDIMLIDGAQISRVAKDLVDKNYLEYRPVPGNQRKKYLAHTKDGSELLKLLKPRFNKREAGIAKLLKKEGIEEMWTGVNLITELVSREIKTD